MHVQALPPLSPWPICICTLAHVICTVQARVILRLRPDCSFLWACVQIGVEYMHIWDHEQVNWIREQIETPEAVVFTKEQKMRMLDRLCWSDHFEVPHPTPSHPIPSHPIPS
jgi:hypothetical protein